MSDGMVFILHVVADEKYAAALAAALAPVTAIPTALAESGARGVQLGGGAASLLIWTNNTAPFADAALAALTFGAAAICVADGASAPEVLRARGLHLTRISGDATRDAETLRETIAMLHSRVRARSVDNSRRRRSTAPQLGGAIKVERAEAKSPMLVRSAVGLTATLAIVGAVVPAIGGRAMATNVARPTDQDQASGELPQAPEQAAEYSALDRDSDEALMLLASMSELRPEIAQVSRAEARLMTSYAPASFAYVDRYEAIAPLASLISADLPVVEGVSAQVGPDQKKARLQINSLSQVASNKHEGSAGVDQGVS